MNTILLVDDELHVLESIGDALSSFGYTVIARPDPESALSFIREGAGIDLVITELRLPGMDGIEFLTTLRKTVPTLPVIMLTGYSSVESYLQALSRGVFEYLNKPIEVKELHRIVRSALQRSAAASAIPVS